MKIVFFGTSTFATIILRALFQRSVSIVAVVTKMDQPRGRGLMFQPAPVKELLSKRGLLPLVLQPSKASSPEFIEKIQTYHPDLFIVAAYGEILKKELLDLPTYGAINIHASLLPKYRGAAPMQRCLMNGDRETGITIMQMVTQMDAGDILRTATVEINSTTNVGDLETSLANLSITPLLEVLDLIPQGRIRPIAQNHLEATYAPKISPSDTKISWNHTREQIYNQIRALAPQPGAWCLIEIKGEKKRLKIIQARLADPSDTTNHPLRIPCIDGLLELVEVQLEGKKKLSAAQFALGLQGPLLIV